MRLFATLILASSLLLAFVVVRPPEIPFEKHTIDLGSSESAAICDINGDGKLDIVSGENWYEAPHWIKHHFRDINYTNNYIDDLSTLALDVNEDGHIDLVTSGWFSQKLAWWENPGKSSASWKEHEIQTGYPIEFTFLVDLDNDGQANEILPQFGDNQAPLAWYERDHKGGILKHVVSDRSYGHGIGVGDVNGDGRNDILTPNGWLEAPPDPRSGNWKFHPDWQLGDLGFIFVADVNNDGLPDVLTSKAHDYGIFWIQQKPDHTLDTKNLNMIDNSWSQPHAVTLVDFRRAGISAYSPANGTWRTMATIRGHVSPSASIGTNACWSQILTTPAPRRSNGPSTSLITVAEPAGAFRFLSPTWMATATSISWSRARAACSCLRTSRRCSHSSGESNGNQDL